MPSPGLPYWNEYLEKILRPRVERIVDEMGERIAEKVVEEVARRVASEQGDGADPEQVSRLLTESLGFQVRVRLEAAFADGAPIQGHASSNSHAVRRDAGESSGDVVDPDVVVRRHSLDNPLARAVGIRKDRS